MRSRPPRRLFTSRPWLPPLVYAVVAIGLGARGPELGSILLGSTFARMSSDSAIALLAAVGSGMMALTGIVFSLVFVALQFGTTAYSPRLADDLGSQRILSHSLGIFSGTFLYSILAIRSVDIEGSSGINLPAVLVAFAWLLASVVVLVLLIPEIQTMTIGKVLERLGKAAREEISSRPARVDGAPRTTDPRGDRTEIQELRHSGPPMYLLAMEESYLVDLARQSGAVVRVCPAVGDPVYAGEVLARVMGASSPVSEKKIRRAIPLGKRRIVATNPMYALRLLADIAIRALSPAVNDPTTAVMALDEIQSILRMLGSSRFDVGSVADEEGRVRLEFPAPSWEDALSLSLTEIQLFGSQSPQVQRRIGILLADLTAQLPEARRPPLELHLERRRAAIEEGFPDEERRAEARGFDRQGLGHSAGRGTG